MVAANPQSEPLTPTQRLSDVASGRLAEVVAVTAVDEELARLQALGVCPGRTLCVLQAGDPLIVRAIGSRVGMSRGLADHVIVRLQACART